MQIERITLRTRNEKNIERLIDKMILEESVEILGEEYKVTSVGVGIEPNNKTENWNSRVFEFEGVEG